MAVLITFISLFSDPAVAADATACPQEQRALLELTVNVPVSAGISAADLRSQVSGALAQSGLETIDREQVGEALEARQKQLIARGDTVGALDLAREMAATVQVKVVLTGSQRQIKGLAQGLYNVSVQLQMEAISTHTGGKIAAVRESYSKPGLGLDAQLPGLMDALLPGMAERLVAELCRNLPAPEVLPAEQDSGDETQEVGTGASQLDSL